MEATFSASQDTTIGAFDFEDGDPLERYDGDVRSSGAGPVLFVGQTGGFGFRRALFKFDLASSANCSDNRSTNGIDDCDVPPAAQVTSASVDVTLTSRGVAKVFQLARIGESWGEGTSIADSRPAELWDAGGRLAAATDNDATWIYRFFERTLWSIPGAPHDEDGSSSETFDPLVGTTPEIRTFSSNADLVSDVDNWLAAPNTNHGWMLKGIEGGAVRAARFLSREVAGRGPKLTISYLQPQGSACSLESDCQNGLSCTDNVCCTTASCPGATACREASRCEPGSGVCQNPPPAKPDDEEDNPACDDSNVCTSDKCIDGSCANPADRGGTQCAPASGACDLADVCVNDSSSCPDRKKDPGTACSDDDLICTADECDGSNKLCQHPAGNAGVECRGSAGVCDPAETCDGSSTSCPGDRLASSSEQCRDASCQSDSTAILPAFCSGTSASCPAQQTESCGALNCTNSACPGSCTLDSQCADGNYCDSPTCVPKKTNGASCSKDNECTTGACADGVCCNSNCGESDPNDCQSCRSGTCTMLTDAVTCRPASGTCDIAEVCSGDSTSCPADATRSASTSCRAASCTNGVETIQADCPGGGDKQCPTMVQNDCSPYVCGGTECLSSCSNSTQCEPTHYCAGNQCIPRTPQGGACSATGQCQSGLTCADGVCCNSACRGQCQACDINPGVCTTVPSGPPHGDRPPCASDGSRCGGTCNGTVTTSCAYPGASTECIAASCSAGVETLRSVCNASGSCNTKTTAECSPFSCGPKACFGNCVDNVQCESGKYCLAGNCIEKLADGEPCSSKAECSSGLCVDGVCCGSACEGQCEACNVSGTEGVCSPVTGDPVGGRPQCVTDGTLCGGVCDGKLKSSCTYAASGVVCRDDGCANGFATLGAFCNGAGTCPPEVMQDCGNAGCNPEATRCDGDCVVDADCALGEACTAGLCRPQGGNGSSCARDAECAAGICTDGVCCNSTCQGQCEACDVPGKLGLCSAVTGVPHGTRVPCSTDGSECGGSCDGTTRNRCDYPENETACGDPATCTAGIAKLPTFCVGSGACPANLSQICPGACSGNKCTGGCANDAACGAGKFCAAGVCVDKRPTGQACSLDSQCGTGFCVEGVCCSQACDGQCFSCIVPRLEGFCTPVSGPPRGGREPCEGEGPCAAQCDGTIEATCKFPMAEVFCGVGACMNDVATGLAQCSGAGTCLAPANVDCAPYRCDGGGCFVDCVSDEQCQDGFHCDGVRCAPDEIPMGEGGAGGEPGSGGGEGQAAAGSGPIPGGGSATEGGSGSMEPGSAGEPSENPGGAGGSAGPSGTDDDSGCGCRLPGQQRPSWPAGVGLALGVAVWIYRRGAARRNAPKRAA